MQIDYEEEPPSFKISDTHYAKTWLLDPRAPEAEMPSVIQDLHEKLVKVHATDAVLREESLHDE